MKTAIIGYGKMGREIEKILNERNHEVVATFGSEGIDIQKLKAADVAIEFSRPEAAFSNLAACFENKIPVVSGTTGWLSQYDEAVKLCQSNDSAFLYASNFSVGVNLFFEINKRLSELMNVHKEYDISIEEIHHTQKLDAPSGTAITLAEQIAENLDRKSGWTLNEKHAAEQIQIKAKRIENVNGTHIIHYDSEIDSIEIKHEAHSRKGFAYGAVLAGRIFGR